MISPSTEHVVKRGTFLYGDSVRCRVEILKTHFRPGVEDDEAPVDDAYGEFYEVRFESPGRLQVQAGGGWYDTLADAIRAVESKARDVRWE